MYRIIATNGQEYGPASADDLRLWFQQGRVNAQTKVQREGETTWQTLGELPEFSALASGAPPQQTYTPPPIGSSMGPTPAPAADALQQVSGPATGLIVTAALGFLAQIISIIMSIAGAGFASAQSNQLPAAWAAMFSGPVAIASGVFGIIIGVVILMGAFKMKKLESHGFAMAASVLAALPCLSPCCLIGLPIGIWAIVVLMKPEVKSAFR